MGMLIYGQFSDNYLRKRLGLKPVIKWTAAIVDIKHLEIGDTVSYNRTFVARVPLILQLFPQDMLMGINAATQIIPTS